MKPVAGSISVHLRHRRRIGDDEICFLEPSCVLGASQHYHREACRRFIRSSSFRASLRRRTPIICNVTHTGDSADCSPASTTVTMFSSRHRRMQKDHRNAAHRQRHITAPPLRSRRRQRHRGTVIESSAFHLQSQPATPGDLRYRGHIQPMSMVIRFGI